MAVTVRVGWILYDEPHGVSCTLWAPLQLLRIFGSATRLALATATKGLTAPLIPTIILKTPLNLFLLLLLLLDPAVSAPVGLVPWLDLLQVEPRGRTLSRLDPAAPATPATGWRALGGGG